MPPTLPLTLGEISLRLLRRSDARMIEHLMSKDYAWLKPWSATIPGSSASIHIPTLVRALVSETKSGSSLALVVQFRGQLVGQVNVANILHGAVQSATIGYWISSDFAGKGITPRAVALTIDYLFHSLGLHRVEIEIRPENTASLRVVQKLQLREEGLKLRYIHIDGAWRDHRCFAMTAEEYPGSGVSSLAMNTPDK